MQNTNWLIEQKQTRANFHWLSVQSAAITKMLLIKSNTMYDNTVRVKVVE